MSEKIRVLIIDDSPLVRETVKSILMSDPAIEVVGIAKDGKEGVEKTFALRPDVITMDLKMPLMSGLEATEKIMEEIPTPIIVVSSMDIKVIVSSLGIGAMDFVPITDDIEKVAHDLVEKVKIASRIRPLRRIKTNRPVIEKAKKILSKKAVKVVAIGISTGGPQALQVLFSKFLPDVKAAFLVTQHIAPGFIDGLAEWLKYNSHLEIKVARAGDLLMAGTVYLAPDNFHMGIDEEGKIILREDVTKKSTHTPSIDVMMKSVAENYGEDAIGVIMTGMGHDGVEGIKAIKGSGGRTIAQDEKTSVIFGMNKIAIDTGCVDRVVPLEIIADEIVRML